MKTFNKIIGIILALAVIMFVTYGWLGAVNNQKSVKRSQNNYSEGCKQCDSLYKACNILGIDTDEQEKIFGDLGDEKIESYNRKVQLTYKGVQETSSKLDLLMNSYLEYSDQYEALPKDLKAALSEYEHTNIYNEMKTEIEDFVELILAHPTKTQNWKNITKSNTDEFIATYNAYLDSKYDFYNTWERYLRSEAAKTIIANMEADYYKEAIQQGYSLFLMFDELSSKESYDVGSSFEKVKTSYETYVTAEAELERYKK